MAGTFPVSWQEVAQVSVLKKGGTTANVENFSALTETLDLPEPDYPFESIPNLAGGRIPKQSPQEDGEFTLEMYPRHLAVGTGNTAPGGLMQRFTGGSVDAAQPLATDVDWSAGASRERDKYAVAVLWTDEPAGATTTSQRYKMNAFRTTTVAGCVGLRFYAKECRIISEKTEFTEGILKCTNTFKYPAMSPNGRKKTHGWQSTNAGSTSPLPLITYGATAAEGQ
jgi:hypothetical protein